MLSKIAVVLPWASSSAVSAPLRSVTSATVPIKLVARRSAPSPSNTASPCASTQHSLPSGRFTRYSVE